METTKSYNKLIMIYILLGLVLIPLSMYAHFHWSRHHITNHVHVEPIYIALPSIADEIQSMVEKIADIAQISTPETYVFRSELPNAFIIASKKKPRLFLSDELFEACSELGEDKGIEKLEWTICHEIAHIQHRDAVPVYIIEIIRGLAELLKLNMFSQFLDKWISSIEDQADNKANKLYMSIYSSDT